MVIKKNIPVVLLAETAVEVCEVALGFGVVAEGIKSGTVSSVVELELLLVRVK